MSMYQVGDTVRHTGDGAPPFQPYDSERVRRVAGVDERQADGVYYFVTPGWIWVREDSLRRIKRIDEWEGNEPKPVAWIDA